MIKSSPIALPTEMLHATRRGELKKIAKWLRIAHIDLQEPVHGNTLLHSAVMNGQLELVRELVRRGANLNMPNHEGRTPLIAAAEHGSLAVATLLVERSADVNAASNTGMTALSAACEQGRYQLCQSRDCPTQHGMVLLLIENMANVDLKTREGYTPLMIAARAGTDDCVAALLRAGANPDLRSIAGRSASMYAEVSGNISTQQMLQAKPAPCSPVTPEEIIAPSQACHTNVATSATGAGPQIGKPDDTKPETPCRHEKHRCCSASRRALLANALAAESLQQRGLKQVRK